MLGERRRDLVAGGEHDRGRLGDRVERRDEAVDRHQRPHVDRLLSLALLRHRDLRPLAMLEGELRRGGELEPLRLPERALREC